MGDFHEWLLSNPAVHSGSAGKLSGRRIRASTRCDALWPVSSLPVNSLVQTAKALTEFASVHGLPILQLLHLNSVKMPAQCTECHKQMFGGAVQHRRSDCKADLVVFYPVKAIVKLDSTCAD